MLAPGDIVLFGESNLSSEHYTQSIPELSPESVKEVIRNDRGIGLVIGVEVRDFRFLSSGVLVSKELTRVHVMWSGPCRCTDRIVAHKPEHLCAVT